MAFPTTAVLDAFTGAGPTSPPSASWGALGGIATALRLTNNQVDSNGATAFGGNHWNVATYGPDTEAFVTVDVKGVTDAVPLARLYARLANPTSATLQDGYSLQVQHRTGATLDEWTISRIDDNVYTVLGAIVSQDVGAGEKIGFELIGTTLKGYLFTGGVWTEILSRTDATYTGAGYVALVTNRQTVKLNDFGGGTVVAGTTFTPPTGIMEMRGEIIADWTEPGLVGHARIQISIGIGV